MNAGIQVTMKLNFRQFPQVHIRKGSFGFIQNISNSPRWDHLYFCARRRRLRDTYGRPLLFEKFEDLRIVVGVLFEGFPCKEPVVAWRYPRKSNAARVIGCGYLVEVRAI